MLEFIRSHQRWALALLALFILPGLGLIGIRGSGFFDDNANVASVMSWAALMSSGDTVLNRVTAVSLPASLHVTMHSDIHHRATETRSVANPVHVAHVVGEIG